MAEYVLTIGLVNHETHTFTIKARRPETRFLITLDAIVVPLSQGFISFSLAQIAKLSFTGQVVPATDYVPPEVSEAERIIAEHKKAAE